MNVERLVKRFNELNHARVQWSSGSVKYTFDQIKDFDEGLISEIIENCRSDVLSNILNPQFIQSYSKEKELKEKLEAIEQAKKEEEKSTVTLGLVEKALAKVMVEEYAPELASEIKKDVDEYIKNEYGHIEKQVTFTLPQTGGTTEGEITHEQFETILNFVLADEPVMLDGASLDRFALVNVDYSPKIENSLTDDKDLLDFVREFRKICNDNSINHIISYRAITRMAKMKSVLPIEQVLRTCLLKNLEIDDIRMIVSEMRNHGEWTEGLKKCAE